MHDRAPVQQAAPAAPPSKWRAGLVRSGYLLAAILLHMVLLLMFADWIIFKAPVAPEETGFTAGVKVPPAPVPPAPPPPSGGDTANALAPAVQTAPPPMQINAIDSINASAFSVTPSKIPMPNIPSMTMAPPVGAGLAGQEAPGPTSGSGSPFGSSDAPGIVSGEFQGFLYDLKQTHDGKPNKMIPGIYHNTLTQFVKANWDEGMMDKFYKSPKPLSTPAIFIPTLSAVDGPKAFGVENEVKPDMYVIWYKVKAAPTQDGTYHFVGVADDILLVRVDGKTVLDGCLSPVDHELRQQEKSYPTVNFRASCPPDKNLYVGTPFQGRAGSAVEIDVLIGEEPGGYSNYFLYMQRDESTYQPQSNGAPLLPIFQMGSAVVKPAGKVLTYPPFSSTPEPWGSGT